MQRRIQNSALRWDFSRFNLFAKSSLSDAQMGSKYISPKAFWLERYYSSYYSSVEQYDSDKQNVEKN